MCVTSFHIGSEARTRIQPPWREIGEESERESERGNKGMTTRYQQDKENDNEKHKKAKQKKEECCIMFHFIHFDVLFIL